MKLRNGDHVVIISGKDKGKTGTVIRVLTEKNRIVVSGVNMRTRHLKATPQRPGQKLVYEAALHASNVMLVDPKTKKATRIGMKLEKGKLVRVAKKSGELLPETKAGAVVKSVKKGAKKSDKAEGSEKSDKKKDVVEATEAVTPAKKPFWQRVMSGNAAAGEVQEGSHMKEDHSVPDTAKRSQSARSAGRGS